MNALSAAVGFLTVIPAISRGCALRWAPAFFGAVGLFLGVVAYGTAIWLAPVLGATATAVAVLFLLVLLTGAIHLDGLGDTADALASRSGRERELVIMRDSSAGPVAVVVLTLALIAKLGLFGALVAQGGFLWLLAAPLLSRAFLPMAMRLFPYARSEGLGSAFVSTPAMAAAVSAFTGLVVAAAILGWRGLAACALVGLISLAAGQRLARRWQGLTGDAYGALVEIGEVVVLFAGVLLTAGQEA